METIDKKLTFVLKKEYKKLSTAEKNIYAQIVLVGSFDDVSINNSYTISPKDTIGKTIRYNTTKI